MATRTFLLYAAAAGLALLGLGEHSSAAAPAAGADRTARAAWASSSQPAATSGGAVTTLDADEMLASGRLQLKAMNAVLVELGQAITEARAKRQIVRLLCLQQYEREIKQRFNTATGLFSTMQSESKTLTKKNTGAWPRLSLSYLDLVNLRPDIDRLAAEAKGCASSLQADMTAPPPPPQRPALPKEPLVPSRPPLASPYRAAGR